MLEEEETQEIMKKFNLKNKSEFPDISRFDPVAQVIGLRPGRVCEITRSSKTSIFSKYYRVCT
jgi:DNA-directed RNA polymerase subunit H (RpoH/RPB5)